MAEQGDLEVQLQPTGEHTYVRCEPRSEHHHHHLVCRSCGRTVEVATPEPEQLVAALATEHRFTDLEHSLDLLGTCEDCARLSPPSGLGRDDGYHPEPATVDHGRCPSTRWRTAAVRRASTYPSGRGCESCGGMRDADQLAGVLEDHDLRVALAQAEPGGAPRGCRLLPADRQPPAAVDDVPRPGLQRPGQHRAPLTHPGGACPRSTSAAPPHGFRARPLEPDRQVPAEEPSTRNRRHVLSRRTGRGNGNFTGPEPSPA
ncbi:Fur family transcriptional regulator [Cellulomonas xiejunii]|uniref:Fur family transcriptional regulator n=1 Tax=Cellulomonas xiejunii TaxID=2968083 RepID=UPI001D0E28B4|nr:transcriptional repressor [Cellulomonas xiejunii]